ncbi:MAG: DUF4434 domain-containing protein [Proteiniphilum sp.]|nr:DUF4434 domain-containing protein [Proteiniphilum sp.]MDD4800148.1 DUF4434 domain-containing protein [Proteiniphilum sp.]
MKRMKFKVLILALAAAWSAEISVAAGARGNTGIRLNEEEISRKASVVKPISGTWINLPYKDVRNKYTNPKNFEHTDPALWEAKVREWAEMGMEYLVFMEVANEGKSYYPSQIMPWMYDKKRKSPVDAILDEAAKYEMKVFMSTGWAKDQDDNLLDPAIKKRQLQIVEELASLYGNHKAFYGWYLPVEDCLCPILSDHAVQSVNSLVGKARSLTPGKKTLISPYGIGLSDFDHPEYEKQLAKLKVDIIAYQDEVGCVRDPFTIPRLKKNWARLRTIHNHLGIEMWANCETFTWEKQSNDRESALIPAAYSRLLSQQVAASDAGVDCIISFMFQGIVEDPKSPYQLGQPVWSNRLYNDYMAWKRGNTYWKLCEAALQEHLVSANEGEIISDAGHKPLLDGMVAEENSRDERWVTFEPGHHVIVIDLKRPVFIDNLFIRTLNYGLEEIGTPFKLYLYGSDDQMTYHLKAVKDAPFFPNNRHDAWIDAVLFDELGMKSRYLKIEFDASQKVLMDEIFVNTVID